MARNKVKKEKPPVRLLGTMFLLVLGLVAVYVGMALGIFTLVQRLVHLEDASYTLLWPILILSVSAILGVLLAIFIFRGYLAPLSRLMQATQSVAEGDYTVRVDMRGARGEVAEYIRSFNKMAEELSSVALLRSTHQQASSRSKRRLPTTWKMPALSVKACRQPASQSMVVSTHHISGSRPREACPPGDSLTSFLLMEIS